MKKLNDKPWQYFIANFDKQLQLMDKLPLARVEADDLLCALKKKQIEVGVAIEHLESYIRREWPITNQWSRGQTPSD